MAEKAERKMAAPTAAEGTSAAVAPKVGPLVKAKRAAEKVAD
tara:strand:+ start:318 stop:443 length:126 start_codon:yes stop_codon:yes gene_type:complete